MKNLQWNVAERLNKKPSFYVSLHTRVKRALSCLVIFSLLSGSYLYSANISAVEMTAEPVPLFYFFQGYTQTYSSLEELVATLNAVSELYRQKCEYSDPVRCDSGRIVGHSPKSGRYTNGVPTSYWLHRERLAHVRDENGKIIGSTIKRVDDWSAMVTHFCPEGFSRRNTGNIEDLTVECILVEPKACPMEGNPINVGTGEKTESETDYSSADGFLKLERRYINQNFGWRIEEPARLTEVHPGHAVPMPQYLNNKVLAEYSLVERGRRYALNPDRPGELEFYTLIRPVRIYNFLTNRIVYITLDRLRYRFVEGSGGFVADGLEGTRLRLKEVAPSEHGGASWKLVQKNGDHIYFTADGMHQRTEYAQGGAVTYQYDDGRFSSKTDHLGRSLHYIHDEFGRLIQVILPDGEYVEYGYGDDESSIDFRLLQEVRWSNGERIGYAYNEAPHVNSTVKAMMALTGKFDADDERIGTYKYSGARAISTEGALGSNKRTFAFASTNTRVTDGLGSLRTYYFSAADSEGNRRVTRTSQPAGSGCVASSQFITYYSNGLKKTETDFNGHKTQFAYDEARSLQTVRVEGIPKENNQDFLAPSATLPAGVRKISTDWHADWRKPVREGTPRLLTTYIYNGDTNPFDNDSILTCSPSNRPLLCLKVQQATLDTNGEQGFSASLDASVPQRDWSYTYNERGQLLTVNSQSGQLADLTYEYYEQSGAEWNVGDLKSITNSLGHRTDFVSYDANGRLLASIDPNGVESQFSYDVRGRLLSHTVGGATTLYEYDLNGNLVEKNLPNQVVAAYDYDAAKRLVGIRDEDGGSISYELDSEGNRRFQRIFDANGNLRFIREYVYDALSRKQNSVGAEGQQDTYLYDAKGNFRAKVDARQNSTNHTFDALGRLKSTVDALNGITQYHYDGQDNLAQVVDPTGLMTEYHYNAFGELVEQVSPDTGTTTHEYDAAGNRTKTVDSRGVTTEYSYDALNRLTGILYPGAPAENVTFTYDDTSGGNFGIGRLTGIQDASGTTSYRYSHLGQVTRKTIVLQGQTAQIHYDYDTAGLLTEITYPSGRIVSYGRDTQGRVETMTTQASSQAATQSVISGAQYLPFGPATNYSYGNGLSHQQNYDLDYRLTGIEIAGISPILERVYSYDPVNNITGIENSLFPVKSQSFSYDALNRLIGADGSYGFLGYDYDPVGNRLSLLHDNGSQLIAENYTYATDSHRLLSVARELDQQPDSVRSYQYDAAGNRIATESTDGTRQDYGYNFANRMASVSVDRTPAADYYYNALGQRVRKVLSGGTQEHYHYDEAGQLLAVTDGSGNTLREYIYWDSLKVAVIQNSAVYYLHNDHLGTPQVATNQNQAVVWMADYEPFGKVSIDPVSSVAIFSRFPGQYFDSETGLNYNYFRDYDPTIGRYIQSDPIGLDGGINTYGYVEGNPLIYTDPLGLLVCYQARNEYGGGMMEICRPNKPGELNRPSNWSGWNDGASSAGLSSPLHGPRKSDCARCKNSCWTSFLNPIGSMVSESGAGVLGRELHGVTAGQLAKHATKSFNRANSIFSLGECLERCRITYCKADCEDE